MNQEQESRGIDGDRRNTWKKEWIHVATRLYLMKDESENLQSPLSITISTSISSKFIYLTAQYIYIPFIR
jgi:hypothetical protein